MGTQTFSKGVITSLFGAAKKGLFSEEKSVGHFWKKKTADASSANDEESDDDVILEPVEETPK